MPILHVPSLFSFPYPLCPPSPSLPLHPVSPLSSPSLLFLHGCIIGHFSKLHKYKFLSGSGHYADMLLWIISWLNCTLECTLAQTSLSLVSGSQHCSKLLSNSGISPLHSSIFTDSFLGHSPLAALPRDKFSDFTTGYTCHCQGTCFLFCTGTHLKVATPLFEEELILLFYVISVHLDQSELTCVNKHSLYDVSFTPLIRDMLPPGCMCATVAFMQCCSVRIPIPEFLKI